MPRRRGNGIVLRWFIALILVAPSVSPYRLILWKNVTNSPVKSRFR